jgi:hypothetical protein
MPTAGRTTKLDDDFTVSAIGFCAGPLTSVYGDVDDAESLATLNRCLLWSRRRRRRPSARGAGSRANAWRSRGPHIRSTGCWAA